MAVNIPNASGAIKTLDDIINRQDRYDINKITLYATTDDGSLVIPDKNLFEVYFKFIAPYVVECSVTLAERRYYRFRPHLLSLDIYGTPSLAWMLMYLNNRECPSKFYLKSTVRIIPAQTLGSVYDIIATRSAVRVKENWNENLSRVGEDLE